MFYLRTQQQPQALGVYTGPTGETKPGISPWVWVGLAVTAAVVGGVFLKKRRA